jgi:uncharacterized protein with FMN-binding domain
MKKVLIAILVIILVIVAAGGFMFYKAHKEMPVIATEAMDLTQIKDGSYSGECTTTLVSAKVKVDVADHKITDIKILEHKCGKGKKAEVITDSILKSQSLDVDTISGATLSSNVIRKAVFNALEQGKAQ